MDAAEKDIYNGILIVAGVVGIILLFFIITIIRYQRRSLRLHKDKIRAEIDTLEKERSRIASDLHDELGSLLSAIKLKINTLESGDPEDQKIIEDSSRHLDSIITKVREISNDLMPNTLKRKGLMRGIEEFLENHRQATGLEIKFTYPSGLELDKQKEINIYRIIQEIVHNTVKHAGATLLIIKIYVENNRLLLMTADNGKGFDYLARIKDNPGLGLRNLQSRAEVMGGELSCASEPDKGTMFTFEIPV